MELRQEEQAECDEYLAAYDVLIGDRRSKRTFAGVIQGIIGAESLCASRIARFSPRDGSHQTR